MVDGLVSAASPLMCAGVGLQKDGLDLFFSSSSLPEHIACVDDNDFCAPSAPTESVQTSQPSLYGPHDHHALPPPSFGPYDEGGFGGFEVSARQRVPVGKRDAMTAERQEGGGGSLIVLLQWYPTWGSVRLWLSAQKRQRSGIACARLFLLTSFPKAWHRRSQRSISRSPHLQTKAIS